MTSSDIGEITATRFETGAYSISFDINGELREGRVVEISHRELRVSFAKGIHPALENGVVLSSVRLFGGKPQVERDIALCVVGPVLPADEPQLLCLRAHNDTTRADLWKLLAGLSGSALSSEEDGGGALATRPPRIPARGIYTEEARLERLNFVRQQSRAPLDTIETFTMRPERLTGNVENLIGSVGIPVGVAGPLLFRGEDVQGPVLAPLATTEGALVASATRGANAITRSGGVSTRVIRQRMMRVPLFILSDTRAASLFCRWIPDHADEIREQVETVSRHARLISVEPTVLGHMVHVAFVYETGDAAGQNMTTTCTWKACQWMLEQMKHYDEITFDNFIVEANMSGDKKVNYNSFIKGRGTRVLAEAFLSEEVLQAVLKVESKQLVAAHQGFLSGSIQVGMVGYNINVANIVAAMFTACGQDIACVHESSLAQLHIEAVEGGLYASLLMPSLIVGTVGGGTHLDNQQEYLQLMGCAGGGNARRLAEIIAGFCLSLDLSTLSAIASGQFATAHEKLGRNRPVEWLKRQDLDASFFSQCMREALADETIEVTGVVPIETFKMGSSIITELTARKVDKLVGHFPFTLDFKTKSGNEQSVDILAKVKPLDDEVVLMINSMAVMCGGKLASAHNKFKKKLGFTGCHTRELGVFSQTDERFLKYLPKVYGLHEDPTREAYIVVMELLQGMELMDTADDVSGWQPQHIEAVVRGIAEVHSVWYGREEELGKQPWLGPVLTSADMVEMTPLWEALELHSAEEFPEMLSRGMLQYHLDLVRSLGDWWPKMEAMPRTLIHNDFNPRNVCLRPTEDGPKLCVYDWELATLGLPQHDLAEFLLFVLGDNPEASDVSRYVELHRLTLQECSGQEIDPITWREGYRWALNDLVVNRLALYMMAHTFRRYGFMERVVATARILAPLGAG